MKAFEVAGESAESFVGKVTAAIAGRELGKIVSLKQAAGELTLVFSKLGTSEIKYGLQSNGSGGFKAQLKSEKIALAHRAFRSDIEGKLIDVLKKLGARVDA